MQNLINHLVNKTGITAEKAQEVLGEIGNYIKENFPMAGGMIDSFLGSTNTTSGSEPDADDHLVGGIGSKFGL